MVLTAQHHVFLPLGIRVELRIAQRKQSALGVTSRILLRTPKGNGTFQLRLLTRNDDCLPRQARNRHAERLNSMSVFPHRQPSAFLRIIIGHLLQRVCHQRTVPPQRIPPIRDEHSELCEAFRMGLLAPCLKLRLEIGSGMARLLSYNEIMI